MYTYQVGQIIFAICKILFTYVSQLLLIFLVFIVWTFYGDIRPVLFRFRVIVSFNKERSSTVSKDMGCFYFNLLMDSVTSSLECLSLSLWYFPQTKRHLTPLIQWKMSLFCHWPGPWPYSLFIGLFPHFSCPIILVALFITTIALAYRVNGRNFVILSWYDTCVSQLGAYYTSCVRFLR